MATNRNPEAPARCPCMRADLDKLKILAIRNNMSMPTAFGVMVDAWESSLSEPKAAKAGRKGK